MVKIDEIDEILEFVWMKKEEGGLKKEELLKSHHPKVPEEVLEKMISEGYLSDVKGEIELNDRGREIASRLIRSHRLAERLMADILDMADEFLESNACTFEHILSEEIVESICTILGHPRECPHGRIIPEGECCRKAIKEVESIVVPLAELKSGQKGKIIYITTKHHSRLHHLTALGVCPGSEILVHQTFPSYVIRVNETDIAIDTSIIRDIYVRRI